MSISRHQQSLPCDHALKSRAVHSLSVSSTSRMPTQTNEQTDRAPATSTSAPHPSIPRGFTMVSGPNSNRYLVPDFLVQWTWDALEADRMRDSVDSDSADRQVSPAVYCLVFSNLFVPSPIRQQMSPASPWPRAPSIAHLTRYVVFHQANSLFHSSHFRPLRIGRLSSFMPRCWQCKADGD